MCLLIRAYRESQENVCSATSVSTCGEKEINAQMHWCTLHTVLSHFRKLCKIVRIAVALAPVIDMIWIVKSVNNDFYCWNLLSYFSEISPCRLPGKLSQMTSIVIAYKSYSMTADSNVSKGDTEIKNVNTNEVRMCGLDCCALGCAHFHKPESLTLLDTIRQQASQSHKATFHQVFLWRSKNCKYTRVRYTHIAVHECIQFTLVHII